jgi:hypothetical protein
MLFIGYLLFGL